MKNLALTFLLASAAVALATVSTSAHTNAAAVQTSAVACCDEPPNCNPWLPPCADKN
jgi:hypothetical protein